VLGKAISVADVSAYAVELVARRVEECVAGLKGVFKSRIGIGDKVLL